MTHRLYASKSKDLDTHRLTRPSRQRRARCLEEKKVVAEAGMLSGISRKRSMRSRFYWFTEFCNSQCLSHFAAPFIVVRAETSIAESCNKNEACQRQCMMKRKKETSSASNGSRIGKAPFYPKAEETEPQSKAQGFALLPRQAPGER